MASKTKKVYFIVPRNAEGKKHELGYLNTEEFGPFESLTHARMARGLSIWMGEWFYDIEERDAE